MTVQIAQRGVIVLPKALRQAYGLQTGDQLTLIDVGGAFLLSPRTSEVDALASRVTSLLAKEGQTLEGMLQILREERERYDASDSGVC